MNDSESSDLTQACIKCGAANPMIAKFCSDCGTPFGQSQAKQTPPPPTSTPPPQPPPRGIDFSQFTSGGGTRGHTNVAMDAETAFQHIISAIQSAGGVIEWHSPPHSAKFQVNKKDFWNTGGTTVKYIGDLNISSAGPNNSVVDLNLRVNWSSMVPVLVSAVLGAIVFAWMMPVYGSMLMILALALAALYGWKFGSKFPNDTTEKILKGLPKALGPLQAAPEASPSTSRAPQPPTASEASAQSVADRIKQLASLLEIGAITQEEYDTKKADLLKEL